MSTSPPRGRSWKDIIIAMVVGATAVILLVAVAGLGWRLARPSIELEVATNHVAFAVEVPAGAGFSDVTATPTTDECPKASYESTYGGLVAEVVARDCAVQRKAQIGNGHHGDYRTLDDVPSPKDVEQVSTDGLGDAAIFTQRYFECTNFCSDWDEPVAIITLDTPRDGNYPTVVVRSEKGELDRADFTKLIHTMSEPS